MIFPLPLSPKVTCPPSLDFKELNCDLSPVICLEQPLSIYHLLLFASRHTYKKEDLMIFE